MKRQFRKITFTLLSLGLLGGNLMPLQAAEFGAEDTLPVITSSSETLDHELQAEVTDRVTSDAIDEDQQAETLSDTQSGDQSAGNLLEESSQTDGQGTASDEASESSQDLASEPADQASDQDTPEAELDLETYMRSDATYLAQLVREGKVTSQKLVELAFEVIEKTNPSLNNVISTRKEAALEEAKALEDTGQPFLGVPILVKGLGHTLEGGENTNGFEFLKDNTSRRDGRQVKALKEAGFIVIGQTSFPQAGWINVTNSDLYGVTHNPWNVAYNPGGSSGGSSAAVAIGQVPIASSSDGGGSTRIPAAWSGLIGLHPTNPILTWDGSKNSTVTHFAETRSMADTATLFEFLLKEKTKDTLLENSFSPETTIAYTTKTPAGTPISEDAVAAVEEAVAFLKDLGYKVEEVDYPIDGKRLMEQYYVKAASSAGFVNFTAKQKLKRDVQKEDVELLTWALYQTSKDLTQDDINQAQEIIDEIGQQMEKFYQNYPIFLTPTNAYPAPVAGYQHITEEMATKMLDMSQLSKEEKLQLIYDQWLPAWTLTPYTQLANLLGTPAISLPTYINAHNLPLGIMFQTYAKNDRSLLAIGDLFEREGRLRTFYHRGPKATAEAEEQPQEEAEELEFEGLPGYKVEEAVGADGNTYERLVPIEETEELEEVDEQSSEEAESQSQVGPGADNRPLDPDSESTQHVGGAKIGESLETEQDLAAIHPQRDLLNKPAVINGTDTITPASQRIQQDKAVDTEGQEVILAADSFLEEGEDQPQALPQVAQSEPSSQNKTKESLPQTGERTRSIVIISWTLLLGGVTIITSKKRDIFHNQL
ncbi:amidase family protein [Facklamia languida]